MGRVRIIPVLLLSQGGLYKTVRFEKPSYVGDPINTVKIFNDKEADELVVLDFRATVEQRRPDFDKITEIAGEAFMPMAYGGGVRTLEDAKRVFDCGYEKVVLNSVLYEDLSLAESIAAIYGAQSVVASVDVRKNWLGRTRCFARSGTRDTGHVPEEWAKVLERHGAGEIMLHSIRQDGTWEGYDLPMITSVSQAVGIPVIACGGAASTEDFRKAVEAGASAAAAGSMFVYQKKGMGVLISFCTGFKLMKGSL